MECLNFSDNKQAEMEQERAEKRLHETETGEYDFKVEKLILLFYDASIFFLMSVYLYIDIFII